MASDPINLRVWGLMTLCRIVAHGGGFDWAAPRPKPTLYAVCRACGTPARIHGEFAGMERGTRGTARSLGWLLEGPEGLPPQGLHHGDSISRVHDAAERAQGTHPQCFAYCPNCPCPEEIEAGLMRPPALLARRTQAPWPRPLPLSLPEEAEEEAEEAPLAVEAEEEAGCAV